MILNSLSVVLPKTTFTPNTTTTSTMSHPTRPLSLLSSACRALSFTLLSTFIGVAIVSGIILTTVRGQQSGNLQSGSEKNATAEKTSAAGVLATNSNNYVANIAALTAGKTFAINHKVNSASPPKYTESLHTSASSVYKPSSFSLFSGYDKPTSGAYFNYATKAAQGGPSIADTYLSHLYSPFMMPTNTANYYSGSGASSSSSAAAGASSATAGSSPYAYSAFSASQPAVTSTKPTSALLSFRDRLLKASASNRANTTALPKVDTETEKLTRQLQVALIYQQVLALQQYRALYAAAQGLGGAGAGSPSAASSAGYGYPGMGASSLYQSGYNQNAEDGASDSPLASASSSMAYSPSSAESGPGSVTSASVKGTSIADATPEQLEQALAQTIAYRQQLALMANQMAASAGAGGGSGAMGGMGAMSGMSGMGGMGYPGYASAASSLYGSTAGSSAGQGYPSMLSSAQLSSIYGSGSRYGGAYGAGGAGGSSGFSSLFGSAMPSSSSLSSSMGSSLGNGMLSSLTGGLSALTGSGSGLSALSGSGSGSGFGLLNSLGMLFG